MNARSRRLLLPAALAACALASAGGAAPRALAGDPPPPPRLPFDDELPPPPPLPESLDRRFRGEIVSFDGERIKLRWQWKKAEELDDFEAFVPIRATVSGGFTVKPGPAKAVEKDKISEPTEGTVLARGTGGIRLRLGMLSDLTVATDAILNDPHDLGVVLSLPASSDESILCLIQDRLFTRWDAAAGNSTMINKIGGIPATGPGLTEFRYVSRSGYPKFEAKAYAKLEVIRLGTNTQFLITPKGEKPTTLSGKDTDTPYAHFQAGLYVSGASADFGPLTIDGKIDKEWCKQNEVLPHFADNLTHPGNRFAGTEKLAAERVERFCKQDPATADPKTIVTPEALAALVGDTKLALVIRIRAAEALAGSGAAGESSSVGERIARLLDAKDREARVLAWRVLRPRLPWHFRYEPDADPKVRADAAHQVGDWMRNHADEETAGHVFVDGQWYAPARADEVRSKWDKAWDLRTPHVRLRTNLSREWALWYLNALEACYRELTTVVGREPPKEKLPISVLVFAKPEDFQAFCAAQGYESKAAWKKFADVDRNCAFDTFDRQVGPVNSCGLLAKLYGRALGGSSWPAWYDEGRAAWFGNSDYRTATWDGKTLAVGLPGTGSSIALLAQHARSGKLPTLSDFLNKDPKTMQGESLRVWYAQAWALHAFFMGDANEDDKRYFTQWQTTIERMKPLPNEADEVGRRLLLAYYRTDEDDFNTRWMEWIKKR